MTEHCGFSRVAQQFDTCFRDELRRVVGYSAADEISKLDELKKSGSITGEEFTRLRAQLVQ